MLPVFRTRLLFPLASLFLCVGAAPRPDGPAELADLGKRLGIEIAYSAPQFPVKSAHGEIAGKAVSAAEVEAYAPIVVHEMGLYPPDLVKRARLHRVVLCSDLAFAGQRRNAIPDFAGSTLYLDAVRGMYNRTYMRKVIHHEFFHIVDWLDDGELYTDKRWAALNPPDFKYGTGGRNAQENRDTSVLTTKYPGFLNHYSTTGVEEDKAEVFANLLVDPAYVAYRAKNDTVLAAKVARMKELVAAFCPEAGAAFWERAAGEKALPKGLDPPAAPSARVAALRGLRFLVADAAAWRKERKCSTCHHGVMTVWALAEARRRGIGSAELDEMAAWTRERLAGIEQPRDTRPGFNMVSTPALYLATMATLVPGQTAVSTADCDRLAGHLLTRQETDGYWAWSLAPAQNRPPPTFESDEVSTRLALIALAGSSAAGASTARERAQGWLRKTPPGAGTQAALLRLLATARATGRAPKGGELAGLLTTQHLDGGFGPEHGLPSDAFATGQALYFLRLAGVEPNRPELQRAAAFLAATQKADGSWPMTPRAHPGAKPMTNPSPIIHIGSAWATLGLLQTLN